jgi:hypothetical protein
MHACIPPVPLASSPKLADLSSATPRNLAAISIAISQLEIGLHLDSFVEAFVHRQMRLANETEYVGPLMTLDCL